LTKSVSLVNFLIGSHSPLYGRFSIPHCVPGRDNIPCTVPRSRPVLVCVAIKQSAAAAAHQDGGTAPPGSKREPIPAAFRFPVFRLPEFWSTNAWSSLDRTIASTHKMFRKKKKIKRTRAHVQWRKCGPAGRFAVSPAVSALWNKHILQAMSELWIRRPLECPALLLRINLLE